MYTRPLHFLILLLHWCSKHPTIDLATHLVEPNVGSIVTTNFEHSRHVEYKNLMVYYFKLYTKQMIGSNTVVKSMY